MKMIDRIFIAVMVLIVSIAWVYVLHTLVHNRAREAINVVWEGKILLPADKVTLDINLVFSGVDETVQQKAFDHYLSGVKLEYETRGFRLYNQRKNFLQNGGCYIDSTTTFIEGPCLDSYITLVAEGENLLQKTTELITLLEKNPSAQITTIEFSVTEIGEALNNARMQALSDGKKIAEATANQLWVQLGRLLQTTEYPLATDYYGPQEQYYYAQSFYRGEKIDTFKGVEIIRKVYLTYDIE